MEPALLTLSGVEVAGATDGAFVSLSVASWLRLGGEVALARNPPRAEAGAPAASSAAAEASPAEPASAPCYERSSSYSDCSEPAAQRSPSRSRSPPARLRPRPPSPQALGAPALPPCHVSGERLHLPARRAAAAGEVATGCAPANSVLHRAPSAPGLQPGRPLLSLPTPHPSRASW